MRKKKQILSIFQSNSSESQGNELNKYKKGIKKP